MLRDQSLIPLSHQHHNALALCVMTDRALASDTSAENIDRLASKVIDRYELEMVNHFELEESLLFPRLTELQELVDRLTLEHRKMTALVDQLRRAPTLDTLREFSALLRQHVRLEESELFERAQQLLTRESLDEVGIILSQKAVRVCL